MKRSLSPKRSLRWPFTVVALLLAGCTASPTVQQTSKLSQQPVSSAPQQEPLVGTVAEVRIPYGSFPEWGPGILVQGHQFVSSVEITKNMMTASSEYVATELDVTVGNKTYTVLLNKYQQPSLAIIAGATLKITGDVVGNTVYATEIDTIQKPKETKYVLMRTIASPEQQKILNSAK